ncbi:MAG: 1-acyl-sn-glycerol-3-phosphate acyltransferase [Deltaproteobacteria bacterium]|nr:1-acyl-sn-glycerol-3-phosphate acyltransferase [Deltaproteobacteria bacterium]NND29222.1 1-acyl-sn-glycerol-3-phosphate acyltransferase [Myxococcales bacterium]MBT8465337.1 1-acyl-sn-glycerol-3-phosphate acyltransferase [Deltaproteobacteria bacterium]MBT8483352.1 1-acyl-sn-glycerol-3-phosphate acyltransferase [Deltaproteobacteria bacterium]NNK05915.1 1-acyl-sn-glycerol-3-phosphate acyltransferase [Myxococcales bacterium]
MSRVRAVLRTGAFFGFSAGILAAYETRRVMTSAPGQTALANRYRSRLTNGILRVFGADLMLHGERARLGGALVVANHQSALDIGVMLSVFQGVLVSRHDVADWPLLGRLAKHGDTIFVDREDRRSGALALREIRRRAKEGRTVVAFPEGRTFPGDSVHEFHPGAFAAVRALGIPVLPVGLAYSPAVAYGDESFGSHIAKIAARKRTRIAVQLGEPLPDGLDARAAATLARSRVEALVLEARRTLDDDPT